MFWPWKLCTKHAFSLKTCSNKTDFACQMLQFLVAKGTDSVTCSWWTNYQECLKFLLENCNHWSIAIASFQRKTVLGTPFSWSKHVHQKKCLMSSIAVFKQSWQHDLRWSFLVRILACKQRVRIWSALLSTVLFAHHDCSTSLFAQSSSLFSMDQQSPETNENNKKTKQYETHNRTSQHNTGKWHNYLHLHYCLHSRLGLLFWQKIKTKNYMLDLLKYLFFFYVLQVFCRHS